MCDKNPETSLLVISQNKKKKKKKKKTKDTFGILNVNYNNNGIFYY